MSSFLINCLSFFKSFLEFGGIKRPNSQMLLTSSHYTVLLICKIEFRRFSANYFFYNFFAFLWCNSRFFFFIGMFFTSPALIPGSVNIVLVLCASLIFWRPWELWYVSYFVTTLGSIISTCNIVQQEWMVMSHKKMLAFSAM